MTLVTAAAVTLYTVALLASSAVSVFTVVLMLYSWRTPADAERVGFPAGPQAPQLSFSLIVPARHEEGVLGATLGRLAALTHPAYEILTVIGHDDLGTLKVAQEWADRHPDLIKVLIDYNWPKTKPKALNTALPYCRGTIVGIFDAEDVVHPELLDHVDTYLVASGADVCQSGIQLMNYQSSWWTLRNCLEYYFHFRSRMTFYSQSGVLPLGGNTMFARTSLVRLEGGWIPDCLAEDCELGIRLASVGARTVVAYSADLATQEETPSTIKAFIRQRTRWDQGFLQVLRRRDWAQFETRRQRLLARLILVTPFLQAGSAVLVPCALGAILWLHFPVLVGLLTFSVLGAALVTLAVEVAGFGDLCQAFHLKARPIDYARLIVGAPLYQLLLAIAAVNAIIREKRGIRNWSKTDHPGVHLSDALLAAGRSDVPVL